MPSPVAYTGGVKTHIALLRGVNVGGNNKLPMADLRAFMGSLGFTEVRTLLQSGNLVFHSDGQRDDRTLETFLEAEAAKRLGLNTTFLLRTADEWEQVIARNPFPAEAATHPGRLLVMVFREPPSNEALDSLRTVLVSSERIYPDGDRLYASFPEGIGNSKAASALMSPRFSKHATGRNWNTVVKLGALAGL